MKLRQWVKEQGWSLRKLYNELSIITRGNGQDYIHYRRLYDLMNGNKSAREYESAALMELTGNEVDSFYDPVEQEA